MRIFALLLSFLTACPTLGMDVLLLGGGGEGTKTHTIFDKFLRRLGSVKQELNLSISSSFNGGHSETEAILKNELGVTNQAFTEKNYLGKIDEYVAKISSGQIKPGENLMVILNTHGGEKTADVKTHTISLSNGVGITDYRDLGGNATSSADKLQTLATAAKAMGVRLAILDLSCHSGHSLSLANESTCVISSSGPNHFSYINFEEIFFSQIQKGKSLEDVFLKTRQQQTRPSFPMISTFEGLKVNEDYYSKFAPYLNETDPSGGRIDKLKPYIENLFQEERLCRRESEFNNLIKLLKNLEKTNDWFSASGDSENLIQSLKSLKDLQDEYIKKIADQGYGKLDDTHQISWGSFQNKKTRKTEPRTETFTFRRILTFDPGNLDILKRNLQGAKSKNQISDARDSVERYSKIIQKQTEIFDQYPQLKEHKIDWKDLKEAASKVNSLANKVSELANKVYDARYRELRAKQVQKNDPCRDFIF
ncbi:MAG: hypothetical protein WCH11_03060 [Bdellovibrio sp.]